MTDAPRTSVEEALDRARDLPAEEALTILRSAKEDLDALEARDELGPTERRTLEDRLNQRIRQIDERDAYDSGLGASMEPEEEDAP